ncbi:hypothetical protein DRQ09_01130 [candidate division KSB1 bacterium]|nr:MAG: hypothetical protein DRQ09_01130 [candidate division KSB1 bacterium]
MERKNFKLFYVLTIYDILLIVAILLGGSATYFMVKSYSRVGKNVEIYVSSRLIGVYSIDENKSIKLNLNTGEVIIKISNGKVWVAETSCPHKICQRMGKKNKVNDLIICVPNKMIIKISGKKKGIIEAITQ